MFILFVSSSVLLAQERELTNDSDTIFWYHDRIAKFCADLQIPTIDKSKKKDEIRFWDDYKVIRLWGEEENLRGEVIYFLCQYDRRDAFNRHRQGEVYFKKVPLSNNLIRSIEFMMEDFDINQIPSEDLIEGWPVSNDGSIAIIESCTSNTYTFKNYSPGWMYLKEARYITYFFNQLNAFEEIKRGQEEMIEQQPFSIYRMGWSQTELGFSSFLPKWRYVLHRRFFGRMSDRRFLKKKNKMKENG